MGMSTVSAAANPWQKLQDALGTMTDVRSDLAAPGSDHTKLVAALPKVEAAGVAVADALAGLAKIQVRGGDPWSTRNAGFALEHASAAVESISSITGAIRDNLTSDGSDKPWNKDREHWPASEVMGYVKPVVDEAIGTLESAVGSVGLESFPG